MVIECRTKGRPDRLFVIKLDGTVVRELKTGQPRIEDPMISPDGHTVAYWARDTAAGANGGSIYTVAVDGSSEPVQLTDRKAGSDADPAWSPDGTMIAFRRRGSNDNFDVYVMRSDGSGVRPVAAGPSVEEKPAWSPHGRQLMIISNRRRTGRPARAIPHVRDPRPRRHRLHENHRSELRGAQPALVTIATASTPSRASRPHGAQQASSAAPTTRNSGITRNEATCAGYHRRLTGSSPAKAGIRPAWTAPAW